jgi:small conductance mechanosensitive channel
MRIVGIIVAAIILTILLRWLVGRLLSRTIPVPGTDPTRAYARQRALRTVLASSVVGVIWAIAVISIIDELGINVTGFVATTAVIGGAIAFGAQTLIRDVIAGFFVLAEDQYGVGDRVDLGHASGVVERISLRSVRLHDGVGRVWHVPHGNVVRVANLSKTSLAVLELQVARDSDPVVVEQVAARLGRRLRQDAVVGPLLTGDPRVVGLTDMLDDRLIYRVVAPTTPGVEDDVRRVWRSLALGAFREGQLRDPLSAERVAHSAPAGPQPVESDSD